MADDAHKHPRARAAKVAGPLLFVAIVIVVLVFDPLGHLAQSAWGLLPDLPDLPNPVSYTHLTLPTTPYV